MKEPLFYQRLAAMGLGQGLSRSNLDLQQGLSRLKKTGQLEKLIPYLIDGWSFDKNLKALGKSNSDICEKIPFKYVDYCYFGAGRAHYFKLKKPITTRWENTGGNNKNFLRGWGFATGFNQNHPVAPSDIYFSEGLIMAKYVYLKNSFDGKSFPQDSRYNSWLNCITQSESHHLDCWNISRK